MSASSRISAVPVLVAVAWWIVASSACYFAYMGTSSIENKRVADIVNRTLEKAGDPRRVASAAPLWGADGTASLAGRRYTLKNKGGVAVVFVANGAGVSSSYVALYSDRKGVDLVLPLGPDAVDVSDRLPAGMKETLIARIEASEKLAGRKDAGK